MIERFRTFESFYPFYLSEHSTAWCRRLHFAGSCFVLAESLMLVASWNAGWLIAMPLSGYSFAWIGHFFFERNKPATFKYPIYSLMGDWVMFKDILVGKVKF